MLPVAAMAVAMIATRKFLISSLIGPLLLSNQLAGLCISMIFTPSFIGTQLFITATLISGIILGMQPIPAMPMVICFTRAILASMGLLKASQSNQLPRSGSRN